MKTFPKILFAFICTFSNIQAQDVELNIERSVKVQFNSKKGYSYNVFGTSDPAKKKGWKLLGGEEGTGESIVFFHNTDSDQKIFFRVEAKPSDGSNDQDLEQQPQSSILPFSSLPSAGSSGTYDLSEAIGESEVGGVYRLGVSGGRGAVVIELPHPSLQQYRQKQIKLSLYRGGTGSGSGQVSLKVPTLQGSNYELNKLVDNTAKRITDEVIVLPSTALDSGRKVVVDLFNDTKLTDGSAGGQWVVTASTENSVDYEWNGTNVRLRNSDGSWGQWVDLAGAKGERGDTGPKGDTGPAGATGTKGDRGPQGLKGETGQIGPMGVQGEKGPVGPRGPQGAPGNINANGYDLSSLFALAKRNFSNQNFDGKDLSGYIIRQATDNKDIVINSSFVEANLTSSDTSVDLFINCNFSNSIMEKIEWDRLVFINCNFENAQLSKLNEFDEITIESWRNIEDWKFVNCVMPDGTIRNDKNVIIHKMNFHRLNLSGLNVKNIVFRDCNLSYADLTNLSGFEKQKILFSSSNLFGAKISYLNSDNDLVYWWEVFNDNIADSTLPSGEYSGGGVNEIKLDAVPEDFIVLKLTKIWEKRQNDDKYYFEDDQNLQRFLVLDYLSSMYYYFNVGINSGLPILGGTFTLEKGEKNKPQKIWYDVWFDYENLVWKDTKSGSLTYIADHEGSVGFRGRYTLFSTFEKISREKFIEEFPLLSPDNQDGGNGSRLVVRSGSDLAPDRLEINLDAAMSKELIVGQELNPSELKLHIGGLAIKDDAAIIIVEEAIGGGKKLVVKSKTGEAFVSFGLIKSNSVPVFISIPLAGGGYSSMNIVVVAPMKAPSLVAKVDSSGAAKSIIITTGGFTEAEADTHIANLNDLLSTLDNYEINGQALNADEVDIVTNVVPTGDELTPFRIEVEIKPKNPEQDLGKASDIGVTFSPPPVVLPSGSTPLPPLVLPPGPPVQSPGG